MAYNNYALVTRRELLIKLCKLLVKDQLIEEIDRIPIEMRPKNKQSIRCCVHKDRAVLKYKIMATLGYNIDDEEDELTPLSEYARHSLEKKDFTDTILTVVDEACSACVRINYTVTNLCKGCEGRPCMMNCPKEAIQIINGQAHIDHNKCVNCGLCKQACPYHAIVYIPVPCEESCPVNAISKDENGIEHIDKDKCINCGKCITACPFGAIMEKSQLVQVHESIKSGEKNIAIVAPAIAGQFKTDPAKILKGIKELGFTDVIEVAEGADTTAVHESHELQERLEEGHNFMTSSCCPAYTSLVDKHIQELKPFVSDTKTPMHYTAKMVKENYPDAKITFVGPCIAKKYEAAHDPYTDYVLNFEEIGAYLIANRIDVLECNDIELNNSITGEARGFAASGGVSSAIKAAVGEEMNFNPMIINGIDKNSIKTLRLVTKKTPEENFIEVMSCEGGCVNGPCTVANPKVAKRQIDNFAKSSISAKKELVSN